MLKERRPGVRGISGGRAVQRAGVAPSKRTLTSRLSAPMPGARRVRLAALRRVSPCPRAMVGPGYRSLLLPYGRW
jgi:hypothetical protein